MLRAGARSLSADQLVGMLRDSEPLNVLARTLPQLLAQHGIEQDAYEVRRKRCIIASGCEQPASPVSNHLGQARRFVRGDGHAERHRLCSRVPERFAQAQHNGNVACRGYVGDIRTMTEKPHGTVNSESRRELAASIQVGSAAGKDEDGLRCQLEHLGNQPDENIEALLT